MERLILKKCLLIVLFGLLLGGCTIKTAYNQLDWIMPTFVEEYVSLDESQEAELEKRMRATLLWHRRTQLPAYAYWLHEVRIDINQGLTEEQVQAHFVKLEHHWKNMVGKVAEDMAVLLPDMTVEQRNEILSSIAEKNEEYRETYIDEDPQELEAERLEKLEENFERWFGPLSDRQKQRLKNYNHNSDPLYEERYHARQLWYAGFKKLLETDMSKEAFANGLQELFLNPEHYRSETYNQTMEEKKESFAKLLVEMMQDMSTEQKNHLLSEIDNYKEIFAELAAEEVD